MGWSTKKRKCQQGSRTTCAECDEKPGCSQVRTVIGRGQRAYEGDCVYFSKVATCNYEPIRAALSFPTDIAIDHSGNIIIADSGNNRVRALILEYDKLFILAGSGEIGFSGDGGPGRKAKLRYPERLTVFMSEYQEIDEIFFSDFRNQRIRKLTYDVLQQEWIIMTIVGTGSVGDGCPNVTGTTDQLEPCHPLNATLQEPRGLAMDREGNLYIADSGNRKIRRVARDYTNIKEDRWMGKDFQTYLGSGSYQSGNELYNYNGHFLSAHFSQKKEDVALGSIYSIDIDDFGDLYVLDSQTNIAWLTPTYERVDYLISGISGRYFSHFINHFVAHKKKPVTTEDRQKVYDGLKNWLSKEGLVNLVPERNLYTAKDVGKAYWMYGHAQEGYWCNTRAEDKDSCPPVIAQYALWNSMFGHCMDISSNVYIPDFGTSVVTKISVENKRRVEVKPEPHRRTLKGCKCEKNWIASYLEPYNVSNPSDLRTLDEVDDWDHRRCLENIAIFPEFLDNPPVDAGGNKVHCYTSPTYLLRQDSFKYQPGGYCGSPDHDPVPWCYVEDKTCQGDNWGYCGKEGNMEIEYESLPNASIFNTPMRQIVFSPFSKKDLTEIMKSLSSQNFATYEVQDLDYMEAEGNLVYKFTHFTHIWTCHEREVPTLTVEEVAANKLRMNCWQKVTDPSPANPANPLGIKYPEAVADYETKHQPVQTGKTDSGEDWTFQWTCTEMLPPDPLNEFEKKSGKLNKECLIKLKSKADLEPGSAVRTMGTPDCTSYPARCTTDENGINSPVFNLLFTQPFIIQLGLNAYLEEFYRLEDCLDWCSSLTGCKAVMLRWNNTKQDWHGASCALYDQMLPYNIYEYNRWETGWNYETGKYDNATLPNETGWNDWLKDIRETKFSEAKTATPAMYSLDEFQDSGGITAKEDLVAFKAEFPGHLDGVYLPMPDKDGNQPVFQARLSEWGVAYLDSNGNMDGRYGEVVKARCTEQELKEDQKLCNRTRHCWAPYPNYVCEYKEEFFDYVLQGPIPALSLRLEACQELCIQTPGCHSIAFPGCFLLNRTNFKFEKPGGLETRVYVRIEKDITVDSTIGKYKSATFKGNNAPAKESLINRATQCKVDKVTGDLLVADTWNHRIRRLKGMNLNCHFLTNVFSVSEILAYLEKVKDVEKYCAKGGETAGLFTAVQKATVEERDYKKFFIDFCVNRRGGVEYGIPPSPDDFTGDKFYAVNDLGVLCSLCGTYAEDQRPGSQLCPSVERCKCRDAMKAMIYTEVFANCPKTNAYYDPWHRTLTAFIACWVDGDPKMADYLVEKSAERTVALEWLLYWKGVLNQRRLNPNISWHTTSYEDNDVNFIKSALTNASTNHNPTESWPWSHSAVNVVNSWMKLGMGADLFTMQKHHHTRLSEL